jgi:hypothetical protein
MVGNPEAIPRSVKIRAKEVFRAIVGEKSRFHQQLHAWQAGA